MYTLEFKRQLNIYFNLDPTEILTALDMQTILFQKAIFPKTTLSIVYSSRLATRFANQIFLEFCAHHQIIPIDFDTELNINLSATSRDGQLHQLAKIEIDAFLNKQNGSLMAASHLVRLMRRVLERGIFTESGRTFQQYFPNLIIESDSQNRQYYADTSCNLPILLGLGSHTIYHSATQNHHTFKAAQLSFIGLTKSEGWGKENQEEMLNALQDKMIKQYTHPLQHLMQSEARDVGTVFAKMNTLNIDHHFAYTAPQIRNLFLCCIKDGTLNDLYSLVIFLYLNGQCYPLFDPIYKAYFESSSLYNLRTHVENRLFPLDFAQLEASMIHILAPHFMFNSATPHNPMTNEIDLEAKKLNLLEMVKHHVLYKAHFSFTNAEELFKMMNKMIRQFQLKTPSHTPLLFKSLTFSDSFELTVKDKQDLGAYRPSLKF